MRHVQRFCVEVVVDDSDLDRMPMSTEIQRAIYAGLPSLPLYADMIEDTVTLDVFAVPTNQEV